MQQIKRLRFLQQHARTEEEDKEMADLEDKLRQSQVDDIQTLQETLSTINQTIQQHRAMQRNQGIKDNTDKPQKVFDWVKRTKSLEGAEGLGRQRKTPKE